LHFVVATESASQRLDQVLAALAGLTRSQARRWIDAGRVRVDGAAGRPGQRLQAGSRVDADPPDPEPAALGPEPLEIGIIHEDEDLIVVDKPAGMVVHPAPGHSGGTLVNALLHHGSTLAGVGGVRRPGIVHRLDRGTSGVMVAAKSDLAHQGLAEQFRDHSIERLYLAFVRGCPSDDSGRVDRPIGRHRRDRKRMSVETRRGREAHSAWRVRERFPREGVSLLEVRPETGRTHQIRVHLASSGLPLLGDPVYGRAATRFPLERPALHAAELGFRHPRSAERLHFEAPLPGDLVALRDVLRDGAAQR
jgi:23S rRNA pseudouridine1911/1915/1917 synthase